MWITVLVMAIAVSLEPFRIGMTVLMLNRPRPMLQLIAFLSGGFAMGATAGLVVIFAFRPGLLGSAHFTLPKVQIVIGVLALLMAILLAAGVMPAPKLPAQARGLVSGQSPWVAAVAGLGIALPSVDYLAVLAVIVASAPPPRRRSRRWWRFTSSRSRSWSCRSRPTCWRRRGRGRSWRRSTTGSGLVGAGRWPLCWSGSGVCYSRPGSRGCDSAGNSLSDMPFR
jgi:hypothetical protein